MAQTPTADEALDCLATKLGAVTDGKLGQRLRQLLQNEITLDEIDLSDMPKDHVVQFRLASRFGKLDNKAMQQMDKALCLMVYYTIEGLDTIAQDGGELTWDTMVAELTNNLCLESDSESSNTQTFRFDENKCSLPQNLKLKTWFRKLVNDIDVLNATAISMDDVQASVDTQPELEDKRKFLDVGILRFPDVEHPYIQAHHVQLFVRTEVPQGPFFINWIKRSRDVHWIEGEYNSRRFKPRRGVIDRLDPTVVNRAVAEVEDTLQRFLAKSAPA